MAIAQTKEKKPSQRKVCWAYWVSKENLIDFLKTTEPTQRQKDKLDRLAAENIAHAAWLLWEARTMYGDMRQSGIHAWEYIQNMKKKWESEREEYIEKVAQSFLEMYCRALVQVKVDNIGEPMGFEIDNMKARVYSWLTKYLDA